MYEPDSFQECEQLGGRRHESAENIAITLIWVFSGILVCFCLSGTTCAALYTCYMLGCGYYEGKGHPKYKEYRRRLGLNFDSKNDDFTDFRNSARYQKNESENEKPLENCMQTNKPHEEAQNNNDESSLSIRYNQADMSAVKLKKPKY